MATNVYPSFLTNVLLGLFGNMTTGTLKCAAVSSAYTYDSTDTSLDDISANVLGSVTLTSVTAALGELDVGNFTFTGISSGTAASLIYYLDSGTASTSYLIAYDSSATNLPYAFSGVDVLVTAPSYLLKLTAV